MAHAVEEALVDSRIQIHGHNLRRLWAALTVSKPLPHHRRFHLRNYNHVIRRSLAAHFP